MVADCLWQFLAALLIVILVSHHSFICMQGLTTFYSSVYVAKDNTENCFLCSHDDSNKSVPSTSSELVDSIWVPTQEGKQTSQESGSASESSRANQALVRNVNCHLGSQAQGLYGK